MRGSRKWLVTGAIILSILGSLALTYLYAGAPLSYVVDSYADASRMIIVDDDGRTISILETTPEGNITSAIRLDKMQGDQFSVVDYLTVDGRQVYIYKRDHHIRSNRIVAEAIYLCNFDSGRLEPVWTLPAGLDTEEQNAFGLTVSGGQLSFVTLETSPEAFATRAVLHTADWEDPIPKRVAAVDYDIGIGFSDFFLMDDGGLVFSTPEGRLVLASGENRQAPDPPLAESAPDPVPEPEPLSVPLPPTIDASVQEQFGAEPTVPAPTTTAPTESATPTAPPAVGTTTPPSPATQAPDAPPTSTGTSTPTPNTGTEGTGFGAESQQSTDAAPPEAANVLQGTLRHTASPSTPTIDETGLLIMGSGEVQHQRLFNLTSDGKNKLYYIDLDREGLFSLDVVRGVEEAVITDWTGMRLADGSAMRPSDLK